MAEAKTIDFAKHPPEFEDKAKRVSASLTSLADRAGLPNVKGRAEQVAKLRSALPAEVVEALLEVQLTHFVERYHAVLPQRLQAMMNAKFGGKR